MGGSNDEISMSDEFCVAPAALGAVAPDNTRLAAIATRECRLEQDLFSEYGCNALKYDYGFLAVTDDYTLTTETRVKATL